MFIMCQKCHTFYQVPKDLIVSEAMTFKCKKCGFTWTTHIDEASKQPPVALAEADVTSLPDDTDEIFGTPEETVVPTQPPANVFTPVKEDSKSSLGILPLIAIFLLLANILLFIYQADVSKWLGKEITPAVVLQNVSFDVIHNQEAPQLRIYAQIINTRAQTVMATPLVLTLFDADNHQVQKEEIPVPHKIYEPHQVVPIDYTTHPINVRTRRIEIKVKDNI